jgi:hypothetical protein
MPLKSFSNHRPKGLRRATLLSVLLCAGAVYGQDTPETEASPAPEEAKSSPVEVSGFVDGYYSYNFNKVAPLLRTFDVQHNAFSLSLAEVAFQKSADADSRAGFRVDLDFGKTADLVASFEPEGSDGKEIYKHIQQAYVSFFASPNLTIDFGKYVTPIGAEVIESKDNWNYNRSVLFGYAIPFYHTGLRATITANDKVSFGAYVTNGWNNSSVIYQGQPGLGIGATLTPSDKVTWIVNYMNGPETDEGSTKRGIFDTTLTLTATPKLTLMGNFDYGKEGDVKWWGVAAYLKYQATPEWAVVGRYEYLDDSKGGFMTIGGKGQTFTVTSDHKLPGDLTLRLEYYLDTTKDPFFENSKGDLKKSQSTLTAGVVYAFGGKI